jgi:hypothetical protein
VAGELDALAVKAALAQEPEEHADRLAELEKCLEELTISTCEAVGAPRVEDDPHWEHRLIEEFEDSEDDLDLEEYVAERKGDPDCERCPFASPYSLYPMDPCEFSAGVLELVLVDAKLWAGCCEPMQPPEMRSLADRLEEALGAGQWRPIEILDARDYLEKAVYFLRFWADHGFGVKPEDPEDLVGDQPECEEVDGTSRYVH